MIRYILDTSIFGDLVLHDNRISLCHRIIELINKGQVVIIKRVYNEVKHVAPEVYENLLSVKNLVTDRENDDVWIEVGRITFTYTHMSRPNFTKRKLADPWIIAHAKVHNYTVVTNECRKRNRQMPDVCDKESIPVITLDELWNLELEED